MDVAFGPEKGEVNLEKTCILSKALQGATPLAVSLCL